MKGRDLTDKEINLVKYNGIRRQERLKKMLGFFK
jgi:hypothetical protein